MVLIKENLITKFTSCSKVKSWILAFSGSMGFKRTILPFSIIFFKKFTNLMKRNILLKNISEVNLEITYVI